MIIIASDYDGTLNNHGVSQEDKDAITKFREKGNKFGIVTGRDLEQALWVVKDLKRASLEVDFVICCTGGIMLSSDGEIIKIKKQRVDNFLNELIEYARTLELGLFRVSNELTVCHFDAYDKIKNSFDILGEFTQANAWFYKEEDAISFTEYVRENYGDKISIFRNGGSIDMPPHGTSKVTGIYDLASDYNGAKIYTVGDNVNDIPMLEEFDSYAVSNARDEVKLVAKHQCNRIADMIEDILKENEQ
jgi:HAD superfamily hydrolase (TIGR01484 family)